MGLDLAVNITAIIMALLGAAVSIWPPQSRGVRFSCMTAFALLGVITVFLVRQQAKESQVMQVEWRHRAEQAEQKLDEIHSWVLKEQSGVAASKPSSPTGITAQEEKRRRQLLFLLRQEYMLSHDNLSAAMLAGAEPLPTEWVENRLKELRETWRQDKYY